MAKLSRSQVFRLSRDTRFLVRACMAIAAVSIVLGFVISLLTQNLATLDSIATQTEREKELPTDHPPVSGENADDSDSDTFKGWAFRIRTAAELKRAGHFSNTEEREEAEAVPNFVGVPHQDTSELDKFRLTLPEFEAELENSESLDETERRLLGLLARGLLGEPKSEIEETAEQLRKLIAEENPPPRYANEILGDVLSRSTDWDGAIDAYRAEVEQAPEEKEATRALARLIDLLGRQGRIKELEEFIELPQWAEEYSSWDRRRQAARDGEYGKLFFLVLQHELTVPNPSLLILCLFAAAIWFIIVTRFSGHWRTKWPLYLSAFGLGIFSATLTLYAVILQEELLRFTHDPDSSFVDQIIYCIAGIGLREETLKLLLFVPLVPFLARRGSDIDALVCAGLVGLGFAFNENIGYLHREGEFTTWGRFLTANFLHLALTGVVGLSLVRLWRRPRRQWDNFLYDFLIVVAAHGIYDALIMVPQFGEYGLLSIIVFAGIAYLFLDQAIHHMEPDARMTVSPLAVFVLGAALLMGVVLCYACWGLPFFLSVRFYAQQVAEMIPVTFIFINRLRSL